MARTRSAGSRPSPKPQDDSVVRPLDVAATVTALNQMTVKELRRRYAEVFGEATRSAHKTHLVRRIVWRMQALAEGGLSERARQRAKELVCEADLRLLAPVHRQINAAQGEGPSEPSGPVVAAPFVTHQRSRLPMPGALIQRRYKGRLIQVRVLPKGFEFDGVVYRSLSAIAQQVTGAHWNGPLFFGLTSSTQEGAT